MKNIFRRFFTKETFKEGDRIEYSSGHLMRESSEKSIAEIEWEIVKTDGRYATIRAVDIKGNKWWEKGMLASVDLWSARKL